MKIYHNPRCSKSRETLKLIEQKGIQPEIVQYLKTPPTAEELRQILDKLGISAEDLLRKKETIFKEKYKGKTLREEEWIQAMVENPKLIERPIVITKSKAIIGRPPEKVLEIL